MSESSVFEGRVSVSPVSGAVTEIAVNGRYLVSPPAATYAVAGQLTHALGACLARGEGGKIGRLSLLVPEGEARFDPGVPVERVRGGTGTLWEQFALPRGRRGRFLLNFASRSPVFLRHGMTMVHDAQVFTSPGSYGRAFRITLKANIRLAGRLQRGILTISEFAKAELVGLGIAPAERIHVIPNGADHVLRVEPQDGVLERLGLRPRGYALALSNVQLHKNTGVLLRAFARPDMAQETLVLVGRARRVDFEAAGHRVPPNVIFSGYVSDGEMRSLQTHARAVLMPSLTEGFGMPPVEGMLLGTPAVIAPCGALPEVCGPGALHADPLKPEAWAAAYARLRDDPALWQSLAQAGQAFATRFTWEAAARRLIAVLDRELP